MPPPQRRIIKPCPIIVPIQRPSAKALGLEFFAVVIQLVARGVVVRKVFDVLTKGVIGVDLLYGGADKMFVSIANSFYHFFFGC